ncbi:aldehyde dehydrogenase family 2 member C4, partial [Vigna radiata var. radiata]|uniref:Aldehyde dehydrogenase family 2 member C4 n=1 Tax=Vigna radiata var. radiata TaxID=3916 RepID=A0A1S3ULB0_VIGRR
IPYTFRFVFSVLLTGKTFESIDPRTGEVIASISEGDKEDIDIAVKAARHAFDYGPWPRMSGADRARILLKWAELIDEHVEELATLDAIDAGKLYHMCKNLEVPASANTLRYYAGAADKIRGEVLKSSGKFHAYTLFEKKLLEKAKAWVVGDPFDPKVQQGPQVDKEQFEKILSYIEHGKREGATLLTGGKTLGDKGYFIEPTIFSDIKDDMLIAQDEIFGPVMALKKFKSIEEAIKSANNSKYGLAAGIVTKNLDTANTVSRSIRAGTVWINCYFAFGDDVPFGGYKMSGFGKDHGLEALYKYLQVKSVVTPLYNSPWL